MKNNETNQTEVKLQLYVAVFSTHGFKILILRQKKC